MKKGCGFFIWGVIVVMVGVFGVVVGWPYLKAYKLFRDLNREC